jgi:hypothetical protein
MSFSSFFGQAGQVPLISVAKIRTVLLPLIYVSAEKKHSTFSLSYNAV